MFSKFREARSLGKIALSIPRLVDAIERIAAAQEELARQGRRSGPSGFVTGYESGSGEEGVLLTQSDEDFAKIEQVELRRARGEYVPEEEEG